MLTPGSLLKKERERRNYSLEDISTATKIQVKYLKALENDEFDKFPSAVYVKGFLQNYAKHLSINPDRVLALYRRDVGEPEKTSIVTTQTPVKTPKFVLTPTTVIVSIVSLFVILIFGYLANQFYNFQKEPNLEISQPSENTSTTEQYFDIEGDTDTDLFVTINDEAIRVNSDGSFSSTIKLSPGSNTIIIKAKHPDDMGKEAIVTRIIDYEPGEEQE